MNLLNTSEIPANENISSAATFVSASTNSFGNKNEQREPYDDNLDSKLNLKSLSDKQVLTGFGSAIKSERKCTHEVLSYIIEMESRRLYLPSHTSLYDFMIEVHGYDRNAAWRRIAAARVLKEVPAISEKVESGILNLSQLSQVRTAILSVEKKESRKMEMSEKEELLSKVEGFTLEQTELILAQELDLPVKLENKQKIHRDESVTLTVTLTKEQMALLEQASDLISHAVPNKNWADVMTYLAQKEVDRRTKVTRKSPAQSTEASKDSQAKRTSTKSGKSSAQARRASAKSSKSSIKSETIVSGAKVSDIHNSEKQQVDLHALDVQNSNRQLDLQKSRGQGFNAQVSRHELNIQMTDNQNSNAQSLDLQETRSNLATRIEGSPDAQVTSLKSHREKTESLFPQRAPISPNIRKEVLNRDRCCQFKDSKTGKICGNTRFPQVDHIQPIWAGGTNDPLNLQQLCAQHNQFKYRKEAGYSH